MKILYNNFEYLDLLSNIQKNYKTVYGWGAFGAYADYANNRSRYKVPNAPKDSFIFDCSGFAYKAIPWGWNGSHTRYGGAIYKAIPELETNNIMTICSEVSTDFSRISPGEVLYGKFNGNGHVGIYAGDCYVYECTTDFGGGVMITRILNVSSINGAGYPGRQWQKHGKLPFIEYVNKYNKCCQYKRDHGQCPGCNIIV